MKLEKFRVKLKASVEFSSVGDSAEFRRTCTFRSLVNIESQTLKVMTVENTDHNSKNGCVDMLKMCVFLPRKWGKLQRTCHMTFLSIW